MSTPRQQFWSNDYQRLWAPETGRWLAISPRNSLTTTARRVEPAIPGELREAFPANLRCLCRHFLSDGEPQVSPVPVQI